MTSRIIAGGLKPLRVVIVGGVAGGATAAARARRVSEMSKIIMLERGKHVSIASCGLPFHVSGEIPQRSSLLVTNPEHLHDTLNLDVRVRHEVEAIDRKNKHIRVKNLALPHDSPGASFDIGYDKLLLATGAAPSVPPLPGLREVSRAGRLFTLRTMEDMDGIIREVAESGAGGEVTIIGAGFIGLEMVESLSRCGLAVTVIEDKSSVLPLLDPEMTAPVAEEMAMHGVKFIASDRVVKLQDDPSSRKVDIQLSSGKSIRTNFVILSIGVTPESGLAANCDLELNKRKAIIVNPYMQTSDPDIYAVGDVAATPFCAVPRQQWLPLGGPANRMARIAADHMFLGNANTDPYRGSFGTSIVRVFDSVAGKTGLGEADCVANNIEYDTTTITGPSHASYYPGSFPVTVKTVYEKNTGKLLGSQVVGGVDGVDKRLDVMATALAGGLSVEDLSHLDLAYAPPFGSARDVINTAGFSGANKRSGMLQTVASLGSIDGKQPVVVDVRDATSATVRPVPSASAGGADTVINIPLEEIRGRIEEIRALVKNETPILTVCNLGKLSYFATRILFGYGIDSRSLGGGLSMLRSKSVASVEEAKSQTQAKKSSAPALSTSTPQPVAAVGKTETLDVCGISCPGPIMEIRKKLPSLSPGQHLAVKASDPGFYNDFPAFCRVARLTVVSCVKDNGIVTGVLQKPLGEAESAAEGANSATTSPNVSKDMALVVFSGELDKVMAAFVLANGAIAMGSKVTMFFTFWGLNALRCSGADCSFQKSHDGMVNHSTHSIMDRMMGFMMPKGPDSLPLTHMQMGGMGPIAMKMQMKQKNLPNLPDLMRDAKAGNVRLVACTMSMSAFGLESEDLIDGLEYGGVADFLEAAGDAKNTLFI